MRELKKVFLVVISILFVTYAAFGDWDDGDPYKMHFPQLPDPMGWDICLHEQMVADDFRCTESGPITDIHFWVSWHQDIEDWANTTFKVEIWDNIPGGPAGGGMPGTMLWQWNGLGNFVVRQPPYTGQQGWHCPSNYQTIYPDHNLYWQINITQIVEPFIQEQGQIYWLVLKADKIEWPPAVGWKTSLNHFGSYSLWSAGGAAAWMPVLVWGDMMVDQAFVITNDDHEPNEPDKKWLQKPDLTPTGIDVYDSEPLILADDFECNETTLITEITVWGSWRYDELPEGDANNVKFTLSIHDDIPDPDPQNPDDYSMPGNVLWVQDFQPGSFLVKPERRNIEEGWWDPRDPFSYIFPGDTVCWKYTFQIPESVAFCQQGTLTDPKVYWLDVQAKPNEPTGMEAIFGWKTSLEHWNDDAVWGEGFEPYPGPWNELIYPPQHEMYGQSIDLAFAIDGNTPCEPEPESDLGDAPDSSNSWGPVMTAYPPLALPAIFPTVYVMGSPPFGPIHWQPMAVAWLGPNVSLENEADIGPDQDGLNNIDPLLDVPDQDAADDGVVNMPLALPKCYPQTQFNYQINVVNPNIDLYVNVWFDWDRNADWDGTSTCAGTAAPEWAVQNQLWPAGSLTVGLNTVSTPPFMPWHPTLYAQDIWMRITLSELPWVSSGGIAGEGGSGPAGGYAIGETEDYFFAPDPNCLWLGRIFNNGLTVTATMMNIWNTLGKPICWCCEAQKLGNGNYLGSSASRVDTLDLASLKLSWFRTYTQPGYDPCADYNLSGRVDTVDLGILKSNWFLIVGPCAQ
ncbi:MAG: hypothetical protein JW806_08220 [Sedimentisphaerales bacterium]|nr:hypothetical protein [Sedimentisphaerales bacterium]